MWWRVVQTRFVKTRRRSFVRSNFRKMVCNGISMQELGTYLWQHIEPDRFIQALEGSLFEESETAHLAFCELCQELFLFFVRERPSAPTTKPGLKAAS